MRVSRVMVLALALTAAGAAAGAAQAWAAESCLSQAQMQPAERDGLAAAAAQLTGLIQRDDATAVKNMSTADLQGDFQPLAALIGTTAPLLKAATPEVEQVYLLDGTSLKKTAAGLNPDAQFYCTLNKSQDEASFGIPQLPPGQYGFAMVRVEAAQPQRVSMLLRMEAGKWLLAGLYPKALTANGHDGLWYWTEARKLADKKQPWNAWLYLQEAQQLLSPAGFVSSTHLDKLATEAGAAAPNAVASGLSADTPLVIKAADGTEYRFTSLSADDPLGPDKLDVTAHIKVDALGDAATARKRNDAAMAALLAAHPELRQAFHGVFLFTDTAGSPGYGNELAMSDIRSDVH